MYLLVLALAACTPKTVSGAVVKSPLDARTYELVQLDNGLRALLISDPDTDMAAASLVVHTGSSADPADRPGLAHLLEHMLFLGSDRFPEASAYREFVAAHGGSSSAETATETTQFSFEVEHAALPATFERFARSFVAPSLDPRSVERERNAVESEFRLYVRDEGDRAVRLLQLTANPAHPLTRPSNGTLETLSDREGDPVHADLREYHAAHYSASEMAVAVLGRAPLPELHGLVEHHLAEVPRLPPVQDEPPPPLFLPEHLGVRIEAVSLEPWTELSLQFVLPPQREVWPAAPADYVASILAHEGPGTLFAALKSAGWIESLTAGTDGTEDVDVLMVIFRLTDAGTAHVSEIVAAVFESLAQIRAAGVEPSRVQEDRTLRQLAFRFAQEPSPEQAVMSAAQALHTYPPEHVLDHPAILADLEPALLEATLSLLTPDRLRLVVTRPDAPTDQLDPLYDLAWAIRPLTDAERAAFAAGSGLSFSLPPQNPYLPEDTELVDGQTATVPTRLSDPGARLELWHLTDTRFRVPQAMGVLDLWSPDARADARSRVMTALLVQMLSVELEEFAYPLQLAGLSFSLTDTDRGLRLTFSGYHDKQEQMLRDLTAHLAAFEVAPERFEAHRARAIRQWQSVAYEWPIYQSVHARKQALRPYDVEAAHAIAVTEELTAGELQRFLDSLRDGLCARMFVHGNLTAPAARTMASIVEQTLLDRGSPQPVPTPVVRRLRAGETVIREVAIDHDDSTLLVSYQGQGSDAAAHARWMLLEQLLAKPFFGTLRTEQQQGYVVQLSYAPTDPLPGLVLLVQSDVSGPVALLERVDTFLADGHTRVSQMSPEAFETARGGLVARLREKHTELAGEHERLVRDLELGVTTFDWQQQVADAVAGLDREAMAAFYREVFLSDEAARLVVRSFGAKHADEQRTATAGCPDTDCVARMLTLQR
jgi:insulysin